MLNKLKSLGLLVKFKGFVVGPSIFAWDGGILINTIGDNNNIFEADRRAMTGCTVDNILCKPMLRTLYTDTAVLPVTGCSLAAVTV